jgi:hypothetical protein
VVFGDVSFPSLQVGRELFDLPVSLDVAPCVAGCLRGISPVSELRLSSHWLCRFLLLNGRQQGVYMGNEQAIRFDNVVVVVCDG